ncbi:unnamed protein product [Polarella glacialis]|uniref:Uncharacterized protein n=1 Tax=Polarella glacialis TaxID=89957 RepID=A0A813GB82_POLGL|nr:unnamed protein product [Polarella glacialis]CAE8701808.1 unnamed protein product [Polarella glacialis]|mmetsp:Transcript_4321/g.6897  ORF Transcript_4321/g.6897 Transcript_4321/m.6897 type:complete len:187 (+) Transcript_4321:38-598(+)
MLAAVARRLRPVGAAALPLHLPRASAAGSASTAASSSSGCLAPFGLLSSLSSPAGSSSGLFSACWLQQRGFGGWRRQGGGAEVQSTFAPFAMVPYGVKRSSAYKESKKAARKAAERARRAAEEKGMLLDPKKQLRMELKRNSGLGWYRAGQVIKHLEMHERGKGPPIDQAMRDRITEIARVVRMGK